MPPARWQSDLGVEVLASVVTGDSARSGSESLAAGAAPRLPATGTGLIQALLIVAAFVVPKRLLDGSMYQSQRVTGRHENISLNVQLLKVYKSGVFSFNGQSQAIC